MGFSEGFSAMQKVAEMVGSKMPKETKTLDDVWGQSTNPLGFLFSKLIEYAVNQIMSIFGSKAQKVAATVQKIKRKGQKLVKLVEKIINAVKKIIQIFKAIAKAVMTVVKPIIMLYTTPWACFVAWGITLVVIVLLFFAILFGRFGSFQGEFMINFDKMQELNQDEQEYTDLLNTGALREAFYQSISDTSFYQTFNLTDMDGAQTNLATLVVTDLASKLSGKTYTSEDIFAQQKCTTSSEPSCVYANGNLLQLFTYAGIAVPQLDNRYQVTDANKNPANYLIQAEALGSYSDGYGLTSYFRDYWNREESFQLDADFLYELNRWIYETDNYPTTEQIVYPEAFVQPVSFVHDFLRIQNDNELDSFGNPYVYVTQRVTLDDIRDASSAYYGKYEYEGLIKSLPSDIVYDYVISGTNSYEILNNTNSANQVNIGNASKYATIKHKVQYSDGTYEETESIMKFYWIVNPLFINEHMGVDIDYTNMTGYVNASDASSVKTNYWYYNSSGVRTQITATTSAYIGPFMNPVIETVDGEETIVFQYKLNEYVPGAGASRNDDTVSLREYTYKQYNPNISKGAFMVMHQATANDDVRLEWVNVVVDYNASLDRTSNPQYLYGGEGVYYDGAYYIYRGGPIQLDSIKPDNNSLFEKAQFFVSVPRVVDFEQDHGKTVYPGEIISINKYYQSSGTKTFAKFDMLDDGSNIVNKKTMHQFKMHELSTLLMKAGVVCVPNDVYHYKVVVVYEGEEPATLDSTFVFDGLKLDLFKDNYLKEVTTINDNNMLPTKHYQLAQIADEHGAIISSSQNLINKTYLKTKAVRSYYRNSDDYWLALENFINTDKDRAGYGGILSEIVDGTFANTCKVASDPDIDSYNELYYCETNDKDSCHPDSDDWVDKKCSVIKYVNQSLVANDLVAKFSALFKGDAAKWDEIEGSAESIYKILVLFEEYLIDTGTEGIEWEYKYYSNTLSEADRVAEEFEPSFNFLGFRIKDYTGIASWFESDNRKYKDTFDAVVELNESRAVSSEYTPIAVVSGTQTVYQQVTCSNGHTFTTNLDKADCPSCGEKNIKNAFYNNVVSKWGWKLNADGTIQKVYGETSYEFPDYYTDADIADEVKNDTINNMFDWLEEYIPAIQAINGGREVGKKLVNYMFNTDYAQNIYGEVNFAYKWVEVEPDEYELQYDVDALKDFYTCLFLDSSNLPELKGDDNNVIDDKYQDIRNTDHAWNSNVEIWRPAESANNSNYGTMVSCTVDGRGCGRVTTKVDPEDYMAMELKSVRDYGLGSVLSYLEGRKVTFFSGIAISETYDIDGVYAWVYSYYAENATFPPCNWHDNEKDGQPGVYQDDCWDCSQQRLRWLKNQAKLATSGYYPSSLMNEELEIELVVCPKCANDLEDGYCKKCKFDFDGKTYTLSHFVKSSYLYEESGTKQNDADSATRQKYLDIGEEFLPSDLAAIADGLNALQGTGQSILEYHNPNNDIDYWFTVTYAVGTNDTNVNTNDLLKASQGYILMMKANPDDPDSKWIKTNVNIAIPYLTEEGISSLFASANFVANNMVDDLIDDGTCPQCAAELNWLKICPNCGIKILKEYSDIMARAEANNQFFNPKGYYLAWYDYATGNLDLGDHVASLITREELVSKYDNDTAATLRAVFNQLSACTECTCGNASAQGHVIPNECKGLDEDENNICDICGVEKQRCAYHSEIKGSDVYDLCHAELCPCLCHDSVINLSEVSDIKTKFWASNNFLTWIAEFFDIGNLFEGAGTYTSQSVYNHLYDQYYDYVFGIDLIDQSKTYNVYMIEEAVTFLGNFVYTYDTQLLIAGDIYGSEKIVSDLVFADRGYIISNYIFSVPAYTTFVGWSGNQHKGTETITKYDHTLSENEKEIIYATNPCVIYEDFGDSNPIKNAAINTWEAIKDGAAFVLGDVLRLVNPDDINEDTVLYNTASGDKVSGDDKVLTYCASNYSYNEIKKFIYTQTYVTGSQPTTRGVPTGSCITSDSSNGGTKDGVKTWCGGEYPVETSPGSGSYVYYRDQYSQTFTSKTQVYNNQDEWSSDKILNGTFVGEVYYVSTEEEPDIEHSSLQYEWAYKWGYTYKLNAPSYDDLLYVDTYNEVTQVYNQLKKNGHTDTAKKIFIGLQVMDDVNDISWFNLSENKIDLTGTHYYTAISYLQCNTCGFRNRVTDATCQNDDCCGKDEGNPCPACDKTPLQGWPLKAKDANGKYINAHLVEGAEDAYKNVLDKTQHGWCIKDGSETKCQTASFGDEDPHYIQYSAWYLTLHPDYLSDIVGNALESLAAITFWKDIDIKTNLNGRWGVLLGEDRLNADGSLNDVQWWLYSDYVEYYNGNAEMPLYDLIVDDKGNLDDFLIPKSTNFVEINKTNFELTVDDLINISQAIFDVYGENYRSDDYIAMTDDWYLYDGDAMAVELSKSHNKFVWNTTIEGTEGKFLNKGAVTGGAKIENRGKTCTVNFHWRYLGGEINRSRPLEAYTYYRTVRKQNRICNDWKMMLVGIEAGDKSKYGTPIPLDTILYGSIKQVTPVETGMFFNEEVYGKWLNRMSPTNDSSAKDDYLLSYRTATSSYLYDYLTNFETYIPLGVMSDADLVNRGADAYTSIQANDNRNLSYTAGYSSALKKYLEMPGWISIVENYNHKTPILEGLISAVVPSVSSNDVDVDIMTQYVAGLIETTIEYAPKWTIEYHNANIEIRNQAIIAENEANKTKPGYVPKEQLPYIQDVYDNYVAIEEKTYQTLLVKSATDTDAIQNAKYVSLLMDNNAYAEFPLLYVGWGAILAVDSQADVSTEHIGQRYVNGQPMATIVGFNNVTLTINASRDDRFDQNAAMEYVCSRFGKFLYKYGNVASATMAYFYGEEYWDEMLRVAATEGISTGPEWHNDDETLISLVLEEIRNDIVQNNAEFPVSWNDDNITKIYTAKVVDYALSYVTDPAKRLFLIRNTTSSLGADVSTIGSLSSEARDFYERLKEDPITVYLGHKESSIAAYYIDYTNIDDVARTLNVDVGVLMAIMMAESKGDPCFGMGTCRVLDHEYFLTNLYEMSMYGYQAGLFGLQYTGTYQETYNNTVKDYPENCGSGDINLDGVNISSSYDSTTNKCTTSASTTINTKPSTMIGNAGIQAGSSLIVINVEQIQQNADSHDDPDDNPYQKRIEAIASGIDKFVDQDGRFANNGMNALTYVALKLSKSYEKNGGDALAALFEYFYGADELASVRSKAAKKGYGLNWYEYFCDTTTDSQNKIRNVLMYYDATLAEESDLSVMTETLQDVNGNYNDRTEVSKRYDADYKKTIETVKSYSGCVQQEGAAVDSTGYYKCFVKEIKTIHYDTRWELSINGFSISSMSLFGDTSTYNEYADDKLGMQNNGIEVYEKESGNSRTDVDVIITATFATEDNFMLSPTDYSLFAFFSHFDNYLEDTARSWFTPTLSDGRDAVDLKVDGVMGNGTPNSYEKNEIWDFPIVTQFKKSPTGKNTITIVEQFGRENDNINGGFKINNAITIEADRGDKVYSMFDGRVSATGYHPIYGNYVEVQMNDPDILISSTKGERYRITGIRVIYGYLLDERSGGKTLAVNKTVRAGDVIGNAGLSGKTSGDQVYIAMYINCQRLDEDDNVLHEVGWLPIDIERYFTTQFDGGLNFTVKYKED